MDYGYSVYLHLCHRFHTILIDNEDHLQMVHYLNQFYFLIPKMVHWQVLQILIMPIIVCQIKLVMSVLIGNEKIQLTSNSFLASGNRARSTASTINTTPSTPLAK